MYKREWVNAKTLTTGRMGSTLEFYCSNMTQNNMYRVGKDKNHSSNDRAQ